MKKSVFTIVTLTLLGFALNSFAQGKEKGKSITLVTFGTKENQ